MWSWAVFANAKIFHACGSQSFHEDKETFGKDKNENKVGDKENEKMKMKMKKYIVRYLDFRASP